MPYKDYIYRQALPNHIPALVILQNMDIKGSLRHLQEYIKSIKQTTPQQEEVVRFETKPSKQAQVDWIVIRSGKLPIYDFVMVLGYSRIFIYLFYQ